MIGEIFICIKEHGDYLVDDKVEIFDFNKPFVYYIGIRNKLKNYILLEKFYIHFETLSSNRKRKIINVL